MDELLPCPLCQIGNVTVAPARAGIEWWSVECGRDEDGCGLCINRSTRNAAITAWNQRKGPPDAD